MFSVRKCELSDVIFRHGRPGGGRRKPLTTPIAGVATIGPGAAPAARLAPADQWFGDGAAGDQATSGSNAAQVPSRPAVIATALT
jgi:hypothetical protein